MSVLTPDGDYGTVPPEDQVIPGAWAPSAFTQRVYQSLPAFYRALDAAINDSSNPTTPLYRWLSGPGDVAGEIQTLFERFLFIAPPDGGPSSGLHSTSDLVDPVTADDMWIPWLAQIVGLNPTGQTVASLRTQIEAGGGFENGSTKGLIAAIRAFIGSLTAPILIIGSYTSRWTIFVGVRPADVASLSGLLAAIAPLAPAGCTFDVEYGARTWAQWQADYPTWTAEQADTTWTAVENRYP
jgi:hypothetical protein